MTGAGGRVARLLRRAWEMNPPPGLRFLWSGRGAGFDLDWDILAGLPPVFPEGAVVLHLAGAVRGAAAAMAANPAMVAPVLAACRQNRAAALLAASTAAVYAPAAVPSDEGQAPAPVSDYGRSKLEAERLLTGGAGLPVCCLRIGNVAGAESLLSPRADAAPIRLDPVPGQAGGPVRSWIGPLMLADVLAALIRQAGTLPPALNIAADPPLAMADLLEASGRPWQWGPPNPAVVPAAVMSTALLRRLVPVPEASPAGLLAELRRLDGAAA